MLLPFSTILSPPVILEGARGLRPKDLCISPGLICSQVSPIGRASRCQMRLNRCASKMHRSFGAKNAPQDDKGLRAIASSELLRLVLFFKITNHKLSITNLLPYFFHSHRACLAGQGANTHDIHGG